MAIHIGRRQVIFALGNAVVALPLAVRAQQPERMRRIGVLTALVEDDPEMTARLAGFRQGLQKRGWSEGRNVSIDICFTPDGSADQAQVLAKELIALQPDVILAHGTPTVAALQREPQSCSLVSSTRSGQDLLRTRNDTARRQYRLTGVKQI